LISSFCVLVLILGCAFAVVEELNGEDLLKIVNGEAEDNWFVEFYGPNCGFCKGMEPIWEDLAKVTEEEGYDWRVGKFNVHLPEHQGKLEFRSVFPGPLPGLHLFLTDKPKQFYEHPNPRLVLNADQLVQFAVMDYEKVHPVWRKDEYFYLEESPITNIDGKDFDKTIADGNRYFVMFYGLKCGACKQFMPTWEKFAIAAKERNSPWTVARMEGFTNMQIVDRYTARPWPSLVFIENDHYYRMDTEIVRATSDIEELFKWVESGEYLEVGEEYTGVDEGLEYYRKLQAAKDKAKKKKKAEEL